MGEYVDIRAPVVMPWTVGMVHWHGMKDEGMGISFTEKIREQKDQKDKFSYLKFYVSSTLHAR